MILSCKPAVGRLTRIGVRYCQRVVFWPRTVSCPGLRVGPNRLYRLAPSVRPGRNASLSPMDDDPMINDPGKHSVKVGKRPVSLRARECALQGVNPAIALKRAANSAALPLPPGARCRRVR